MELTNQQQQIFDLIETTSSNILVTGKPGTGKSVLINYLIANGQKKYSLSAPTGLAALNIKGRTLHSMFKLPTSEGIIHPDYNKFPQDDKLLKGIKYNLKHLIIDEISMVRADMFDYLDRFIRYAKGVDQPFGGVQLIIVGDFFQLPPVSKGPEQKHLEDIGYDSPFAFSAKIFAEANFLIAPLTEVLRQKDDKPFIKLLHDARTGSMTIPQMTKLNKLVGKLDDLRITLTGINKQADEINQQYLRQIQQPAKVFNAQIFGEWPAYPTDKELKLKVGAQVMVKMNAADRPDTEKYQTGFESQVVNGSIAVVVEIVDVTDGEPYVVVELENGDEVKIYTKTWEKKIKRKVGDEWEEVVVASFTQMPLQLAWAISIHKSQGQSFDKVYIDPSKIFIEGQMYVALSRCRTLSGMRFSSPVNRAKFMVNDKVLQFYKKLKI